MSASNTLLESPAFNAYVDRMKSDVACVIESTYSLPRFFDIGEPELKRSLHLEASALACHWIQAFSEATPEMLMWAKLFSKQLIHASEASSAFGKIGYPGEAPRFFANRLEYYRENKATWELDEHLLTSWIGVVNFCALLRFMKVPPMIGKGQEAEILLQQKGNNLEELQSTLGIDPRSQEYLDLMGEWLKNFTENLAKITTESDAAFVNAMIEVKKEGLSAVKQMQTYKTFCFILAAWCLILPFLDFEQIWIYQITRIAVTIGAVFLAIILRGWQMVAAAVVAILFNPIIPIDFDRQAWMVVDLAASVFFTIVGFWPSPHYRIKDAQEDAP
jgi:hypothetical protein